MFCMQCGQKLPDEAKFCISCGAKIPNFTANPSNIDFNSEQISLQSGRKKAEEKPPEESESVAIEFTIHDNPISFGDSIINYVKYRKSFYTDTEKYLISVVEQTGKIYMSETDPDKKFELFADMGQKIITYAFDKAHEFIIGQGVYTISRQQLINYAGNNVRAFYNAYQKLEEDYLKLVANEEQIREYREQVNSSPGPWSGGGFGIKGAMKGAITASALNLGSNMLRRIGGAISDSIDRSIITRDKNKLLSSKKWINQFKFLLFFDFDTIFNKAYEILSENSKIAMPKFDFKQAKIFFENAKHTTNQEIRIKMYALAIQNNPFFILAYKELLYDIDNIPVSEVLEPVDYFLVSTEKKNLAGMLCAGIKSDISVVPVEQQKEFLQKYIDSISTSSETSEFIGCFSSNFLPFLEDMYEKLDERDRTTEDGTILPSREEFSLYQNEIAVFQDFVKAAGETTLLAQQEKIWREAQAAGFQSQELNKRIASSLQVVQLRKKLIETLQAVSERVSYETELYEECNDRSTRTSDINEKMSIWQEAKKEIVTYPLLVQLVQKKIRVLEKEQHEHEEQILNIVSSYKTDMNKCSTALDKLSLWRMILLDIGENAPSDVVKLIQEYILSAKREYLGAEFNAEETGYISLEEENSLLTSIEQRYKKLGGYWPVYTRKSESFDKKMINALAKISKLEENEQVLFLYDTSIFGNGKNGLILTNKKLHSKEFHILWEDISSFKIITENDSTVLSAQLNAIVEGEETRICGAVEFSDNQEKLMEKISAPKFLMEITRRMIHTYNVNE